MGIKSERLFIMTGKETFGSAKKERLPLNGRKKRFPFVLQCKTGKINEE